jgi:hypothetical protein
MKKPQHEYSLKYLSQNLAYKISVREAKIDQKNVSIDFLIFKSIIIIS